MTPEQAAAIKTAALDWIAAIVLQEAAADALSTEQTNVKAKEATLAAAMDAADQTIVWGSGYLLQKVGPDLSLVPVPSVD